MPKHNDLSFSLSDDFRCEETALNLLSSIKHTRLEGMVIEYEFEQIFLDGLRKAGWTVVDAMVLRRKTSNGTNEFLVVSYGDETGLGRLGEALKQNRQDASVRLLRACNGELKIYHDGTGEKLETPGSWESLYGPTRNNSTNAAAIDFERVKQIYWGLIAHELDYFVRCMKDLVIKDYYIDPASSALWDLDCFAISPEGQIYNFEVKHKYPMQNYSYGMNVGEYQLLRDVCAAGIEVVHVILNKPRWEKEHSSMYLFTDRKARENAVWSAAYLKSLQARMSSTAPDDTSLYGDRQVGYYSFDADSFRLLGKNSDSRKTLVPGLLKFMDSPGSRAKLTRKVLKETRIA